MSYECKTCHSLHSDPVKMHHCKHNGQIQKIEDIKPSYPSKVKLKTAKELKSMVKNKEIQMFHGGDSGETVHYGTNGNPSYVLTVWWDDYGKEYLIVDHPNPISKEQYEKLKIFFNE